MSSRLEEIDWQETPLGPISLRRRLEPTLKVDVYEVKLGDEYLMSSLFTVSETELAHRGLALTSGEDLAVLVGGLGLGYTAVAALTDPRVTSLTVVEALGPVIGWHVQHLLPDTIGLTADPRTRLIHGDFFDLVGKPDFGAGTPQQYDAILLDIDHTPSHVLHPSHAGFYTADGLRRLHGHLVPGGTFALWSDDPPDEAFTALLASVFSSASGHVVAFANPLTGGESACSVYLAEA